MERQTPEQDAKTGRFVSGNIGGGRPKGSRNKLGEAFVEDLYADWQENGAVAIKAVRTEKPDAYLKVIASILPKDLNVNVNPLGDMTDEQLVDNLRRLNELLGPFLAAQGMDSHSEGVGQETTH